MNDDCFVFAIALSEMVNLEHKSLILCLRYRVRGLEFWDNNDGNNFRVKFRGAPDPATPRRAMEEGRPPISLAHCPRHGQLHSKMRRILRSHSGSDGIIARRSWWRLLRLENRDRQA